MDAADSIGFVDCKLHGARRHLLTGSDADCGIIPCAKYAITAESGLPLCTTGSSRCGLGTLSQQESYRSRSGTRSSRRVLTYHADTCQIQVAARQEGGLPRSHGSKRERKPGAMDVCMREMVALVTNDVTRSAAPSGRAPSGLLLGNAREVLQSRILQQCVDDRCYLAPNYNPTRDDTFNGSRFASHDNVTLFIRRANSVSATSTGAIIPPSSTSSSRRQTCDRFAPMVRRPLSPSAAEVGTCREEFAGRRRNVRTGRQKGKFATATAVYQRHLECRGDDGSNEASLCERLGIDDPSLFLDHWRLGWMWLRLRLAGRD